MTNDKLQTNATEKIAMKLFVWEDVLKGYRIYGIMIAFAPDVETARELLRQQREEDIKEEELKRDPKVYDAPFAVAIGGCDD